MDDLLFMNIWYHCGDNDILGKQKTWKNFTDIS